MAIATVVPFLLSNVDPEWFLVELGILGVAFTGAMLILIALAVVVFPITRDWLAAVGTAFVALVLFYVFLVVEDHPTWESIHEFGIWQWQGLSFLFVIALNLAYNWEISVTWPSKRKRCLECATFVDGRARICPFCGYRWLPPLAKSEEDDE